MGWHTNKYDWEDRLDGYSDSKINELGVSRDKVKEILQTLSDEGVVKAKVIN